MKTIATTLCAAVLTTMFLCVELGPEASSGTAAAQNGSVKETETENVIKEEAKKIREREAAFEKLMSNAVLDGQWRLVGDGKLGRERVEKYTIGKVSKIKDNKWTIEARIEYADKDVRIPVPVNVDWAGDTPVISVTDLWLPGLGKYTARLTVYKGLYAGSWFAPDHGGLMSGVIKKSEEKK